MRNLLIYLRAYLQKTNEATLLTDNALTDHHVGRDQRGRWQLSDKPDEEC